MFSLKYILNSTLVTEKSASFFEPGSEKDALFLNQSFVCIIVSKVILDIHQGQFGLTGTWQPH